MFHSLTVVKRSCSALSGANEGRRSDKTTFAPLSCRNSAASAAELPPPTTRTSCPAWGRPSENR